MSDPILDGETPKTYQARHLGQEGLGSPAPSPPSRSTLIWRLIAVSASVFGTGVLATTELPRLGGRGLWMLPGGIAAAAMVRWGTVQWVAVFAGGLALELSRGLDLPEALVIAACNPLGVLLIVLILRRGQFDPRFSHRRDVPLFIGATIIGQAPPAVLGTLMLAIQYPVVDPTDNLAWSAIDVVRWWLNNVFGTLLLAPLLIAMNRASFAALVKHKLAASLCLAMAILVAVLVVLPPPLLDDSGDVREPILALSAALVVVSCLRLGFVPTATLAAALAVTEALAYSFKVGAFRTTAEVPGLVALWSYVSAMIGTTLILTTLLSEQQRAERQYGVLLRAILDGLQTMVCLVTADGRIVEINRAPLRAINMSRDEIIGQVLPETPAFSYSAEVQARVRDALADAVRGNMVRYDEIVRIAGERRIIAEMTFVPLYDIGGAVTQVVVSALDITARKQLEVRILEENKRSRLFLRNAGDAVHILDDSGRLVEVSDSFCAQLGYSREEIIGRHPDEWVAHYSPEKIASVITRAINGESLRFESLHRRKDGSLVDVEVSCNAFEISGAHYVYCAARDLTEIRQLQKEVIGAAAREQSRLAQELHDGLGQELAGGSLMALAFATRAQRQGSEHAAGFQELADIMSRSIGTARSIIHGLSPLTSVDGDLVAGLTRLASDGAAGRASVRVEADADEPLDMSMEDRSHLFRIAQEAIQNAQKYAAASRIDVQLTSNASEVRLVISDDGVGIADRPPRGTGHGMHTMRYRAAAIGGRLSIDRGPDGGTIVMCSVRPSSI
ncbi:MAG: PAS domain S-box protein [Steroidobacteraceae bacterium]